MDIESVVQYWLVGAKNDLKVAESLFEKRHYPQCLFFVHLSVEKRLKAIVVAKTRKHAPFTHNLLDLAQLVGLSLSKEQQDHLQLLIDYNKLGRYPDASKPAPSRLTRTGCERTMRAARSFSSWLSRRRGSSVP